GAEQARHRRHDARVDGGVELGVERELQSFEGGVDGRAEARDEVAREAESERADQVVTIARTGERARVPDRGTAVELRDRSDSTDLEIDVREATRGCSESRENRVEHGRQPQSSEPRSARIRHLE